jgi:glycine/D-amino acid oxidase-like deaminating enzyme
MKSIVLGAAIVGATSAYQLARAGHEVTVIDRLPGPALETSFADAGEVSFGYCSPWVAPAVPAKAMKWLFMKHAPLILRPKVNVAMLSWLLKMLSNCTSTRSHKTRRPLPQHRPRHARVDNELWIGPSDRQHCQRSQGGDRRDRPCSRALWINPR